MKYVVNAGCIGCGLCAGTCPEVFSMGDDGLAVTVDAEVPAGAEAQASLCSSMQQNDPCQSMQANCPVDNLVAVDHLC